MPVVGELELARLVAIGTGEASLYVSEQLGLQERLRQTGAVDGDERPAAAPALPVDIRCDELFADASLASDQHGCRRGCQRPDLCEDVLYGSALAEDLVRVALVVSVAFKHERPFAARPTGGITDGSSRVS